MRELPDHDLPPSCGTGKHPEIFSKVLRLHMDEQTVNANNAYGRRQETVPAWAILIVMVAVAIMVLYVT